METENAIPLASETAKARSLYPTHAPLQRTLSCGCSEEYRGTNTCAPGLGGTTATLLCTRNRDPLAAAALLCTQSRDSLVHSRRLPLPAPPLPIVLQRFRGYVDRSTGAFHVTCRFLILRNVQIRLSYEFECFAQFRASFCMWFCLSSHCGSSSCLLTTC